jgi:anti-sigma-K factor RskA
MKTPTEDHDLLRWLDGEMSAAEKAAFESRLAADPALKAEAELMQRLSADLRTHLPAEMPVPYADFFNSQIQVRLAQDENQQLSAPAAEGWFGWLRKPWLTPAFAAAAIAMAALTMWQNGAPSEGTDSLVNSIYVPNSAVKARSFHSDEAQATVLMLDGLEEMPADRKIVGFNIDRSEVDEAVAATTLFGTDGKAVAVMAKDARNQPLLLTSTTPRG